MLEKLEELRPRWRAAGFPEIEVGIGINTGPMSVGFVGSQDRFYNYTVLGDAVNLASRLEGANKEYGTRTLMSGSTLERVRGEVVARQVDAVRVKGRRDPVVLHELIGLAPAAPGMAAFLAEFEWGLNAWKGQRWDESAARFRKADQLRGGDPCSRVYLARCDAMRLHPPGPEWDGVYEMKGK
jgi:adenylate cyclase